MKKKSLFLFPVPAFLIIILTSAVCKNPDTPKEIEINQYKGEKLGSVNQFRENSIKGPQKINIDTYKLEVTLPDNITKEYSYSNLLAFPKTSKMITLNCVEGWSVKILWEGFPVRVLIPEKYRKKKEYVVKLFSQDGYSTSLTLDYILDHDIILAHHMNGITLPEERGFPLQLVAESKWGYKWIKWITKIEISKDKNFRGYWESRGYNNKGDISGPVFEQ